MRGTGNLSDKFAEFNAIKQKAEAFMTAGGILLGIAGIIILLVSPVTASPDAVQAIGFVGAVIGGILLAIGGVRFSKLNRTFKNEVLVKVMRDLLPGTVYSPNSGLDPATVYRTECLKRADRFRSEDLITGDFDGVAFRCSDVVLEEKHVERTKDGYREYYVAFFTGRIFEVTFNKEFEGYLQVLEGGSPISNRPFQKVALESIDFNKKFRTYSTNELSAFLVLTPDIMERMMQLEKENPGRISFSFTGSTLYIALNNNKNTFELRPFRKIDDSMIEEFKKDFLVIKDIITLLKLNQKIFKNN